MESKIRIGTRDSRLAVWQATLVMEQLESAGHPAELVFIKSEGDIDLVTPLYAIGVQGVFTRNLDAALLSGRIDLAVHSMKDVPVQLAQGLRSAAVLPRADPGDLLVLRNDAAFLDDREGIASIATSSLRRKAQWLHRYPNHRIEVLRGNVNTRLKKVALSDWNGALFATAGLDRIGQRPSSSLVMDWIVPAPAQGAILVVCREGDEHLRVACDPLHDEPSAACVHIERTFLSELMGGCSTPVGALAEIREGKLHFKGNICSLDGKTCINVQRTVSLAAAADIGREAALELLDQGAASLIQKISNSLT